MPAIVTNEQNHLLIVEDNEADAFLAKDTLQAAELGLRITIVKDGVEAIEYMTQQAPFGDADRPDLVLLDLNLPRLDGHGVLREMRGSESLRRIPVVVLSTSDAEVDIEGCYDLGANCYVTKPVGLKAYQAALRSLDHFWFRTVKLP